MRLSPASPTIATHHPTRARSWGLLGVLILGNILAFVDRQILGLMVQPMRADLGISDTEISLLQGFAFAIFYAVMGLPLGRWADQTNRRNMIIGGVALWSVMTVACGLATSYRSLFVARIGVGVGEAALVPAAYSMLCDSFRPERRGMALGIFNTSIYLGIGVSIVLAGMLLGLLREAVEVTLPFFGSVRSWQAAFILAGVAGIPLIVMLLAVSEPARSGGAPVAPPVRAAFDYLGQHRRGFALQIGGFALLSLSFYGLSTWVPTFFIRIHEWSASQAGIAYGMAVTLPGILGVVAGGVLGDRLRASGQEDARLALAIVAALLWIPFAVAGLSSSQPMTGIILLGVSALFSSAATGAGLTAMQDVVPDWLRGQAAAVYLFVINLIGLGLGPTAIALVSDRLLGGDAYIGKGIVWVVVPSTVLGVAMIWAARRPHRAMAARTA